MKILTTLVVSSAFTLGGVGAWKLKPAVANKEPLAFASKPKATAQMASPREEQSAQVLPVPVAESTPVPATSVAKAEVEFENADLITAVQQGVIEASISGNARDFAIASLRSNSPTPYHVQVPAGQVLESGRSAVVVLHNGTVELMPGQKADIRLRTAALRSTNKVGSVTFKLSYQAASRAQLFITWLSDHPEISTGAAQTAILALTENLPVNAFSKFAPANGAKGKFDTDAFRVETSEIIGALGALRESGVGMDNIALTLDPQLRIEAMIEPLSRESAKRYYGISEGTEWEFWKRELLQGDPSTRHYALFGIARFYPDVAMEMLPKWAREPKTHPVYRVSAIQAIADTQRPEAVGLLRQLAEEVGVETELGKAAVQAATFLDKRLSQVAQNAPIVAFRGKDRVSGL